MKGYGLLGPITAGPSGQAEVVAVGSPFHPQHQTVETAADPEQGGSVTWREEAPLLGQSSGQWESDGSGVSEKFVGDKVLFRRDLQGL